MTQIPVQERSSKRGIRIAVVVTAGAAALAAGMHITQRGPKPIEKPASHSISYLNSDEMESGVTVKNGDNPTSIADVVNGGHGRLYGQAEQDAAKYVQQQGSGLESDGKTSELHPGEVVKVPVLTDEQIRDVNSGNEG